MHLHGHHFHLLYKGREAPFSLPIYQSAINSFNTGQSSSDWTRLRTALSSRLSSLLGNPLKRDTIMAEKYQFMIVAFVADNPGVWALHLP